MKTPIQCVAAGLVPDWWRTRDVVRAGAAIGPWGGAELGWGEAGGCGQASCAVPQSSAPPECAQKTHSPPACGAR